MTGRKVTMTDHQNTIATIKGANIELRNLEVAYEAHNMSAKNARDYVDYLEYMVALSTKLHKKCVEALVSDAMSTLHKVGYEVVTPQQKQTTTDLNIAIALLVRNGYKVTDPNGGNC